MNSLTKNRDSKELTFLKGVVKKIQAQYGYIGLANIQDDLAIFLKFAGWKDLIKAPSVKIVERMKENPLVMDGKNIFDPLLKEVNR